MSTTKIIGSETKKAVENVADEALAHVPAKGRAGKHLIQETLREWGDARFETVKGAGGRRAPVALH